MAGQRHQYLLPLYDLFPVLPITQNIAQLAGQIRFFDHKRDEKNVQTQNLCDALIAATAIEHNHCLITNNVKDYAMPPA